MNKKQKCCVEIYDTSFNFPRSRQCRNNAIIKRNGKAYCGIHDPVRIAKKAAEKLQKHQKTQTKKINEAYRINFLLNMAKGISMDELENMKLIKKNAVIEAEEFRPY